MKKSILTLVILLSGTVIFGQSVADFIEVQRLALKAEKKALVEDAMELSDAQNKVFWPLYDEYNEKTFALKSQIYDLILDYANNYLSMSDEKAIELWKDKMEIDEELMSLQKAYFKKFIRVLPGETAVKYFQVENKISMIINAELADLIPLIR